MENTNTINTKLVVLLLDELANMKRTSNGDGVFDALANMLNDNRINIEEMTELSKVMTKLDLYRSPFTFVHGKTIEDVMNFKA